MKEPPEQRAARLDAEVRADGRTIRLECKCGVAYNALPVATFYRCSTCGHVYDMLPKGQRPDGSHVDARADAPAHIRLNDGLIQSAQATTPQG